MSYELKIKKLTTKLCMLRSCSIVLLRKSELQNAYDYVGWALPTSPPYRRCKM